MHGGNMKLHDTVRVLKARYRAVATRRRKMAMGLLPRNASPKCTLCEMEDDTIGHRLLRCANGTVGGMITNRHNWVVRYLAGVYMRGKRGGWSCRYNAGSKDRGSSHRTIPKWITDTLPGVGGLDEREIRSLTPDIVVLQGVRPSRESTAHPRRKVVVHILEVGYAGDAGWRDRHKEKKEKYEPLTKAMHEAGWRVELHVMILGATGMVYEHNDRVLEWLGVDNKKERERALRELAAHGAKEASGIMAAYEKEARDKEAVCGHRNGYGRGRAAMEVG
jgi:hypothetical protein